jgi:hypothetical protein
MNETKARGEAAKGMRRHRSRPVPKWVKERQELDEMARRRCLLILSVLSGEKPVTDAIAELKLSRGRYYQLEELALEGMLEALSPAPAAGPGRPADQGLKIAQLEAKVAKMEQEKRRMERLLFLTRKLVKPGRVTMPGVGRPNSAKSGSPRSSDSPSRKTESVSLSTPRTAGVGAP